jgi:hypothetical protein
LRSTGNGWAGVAEALFAKDADTGRIVASVLKNREADVGSQDVPLLSGRRACPFVHPER